jgi:hypothetical protein
MYGMFREDVTLFLWNFVGTNESIDKVRVKVKLTLEQATKAQGAVEV